jgi:hypothetical protein
VANVSVYKCSRSVLDKHPLSTLYLAPSGVELTRSGVLLNWVKFGEFYDLPGQAEPAVQSGLLLNWAEPGDSPASGRAVRLRDSGATILIIPPSIVGAPRPRPHPFWVGELTKEIETVLAWAFHHGGNEQVATMLTHPHRPMLVRMARQKWRGNGTSLPALVEYGMLGLREAAKKPRASKTKKGKLVGFDPMRGFIVRGAHPNDAAAHFAGGHQVFGLTWTHADSSDSGAGNQDFTITATDVASATGTWTLSSFNSHANVMICIEINGAPEFACFLINQGAGLSGTWTLANWTNTPFRRLSVFYNG